MRRIMIAVALLLAPCAPAIAQDNCPPLKLLVTTKLEWNDSFGLWLVPAAINGTHKSLLLDTGGVVSSLTEDTVSELGLRKIDSEVELFDASGHKADKKVRVKEFQLGNSVMNDAEFQVFGSLPVGAAGTFIANPAFDIDLDFGAGTLNYISPDHCAGKVVYWSAPAVAVVPLSMRNGHAVIKVTLNGHPLDAAIDTGASASTMQTDVAGRIFGLSPNSPGMTGAGNINGDAELPAYRYIFDTMSFEGVTVQHPRITIFTDNARKGADNRYQTGSWVKRESDLIEIEPMILGMNVLKHLHIYLAYKEHKAYITPAIETASTTPDSGN